MLDGHPTLDSGTKRLLELGIRQQLHRPLHWSQSAMICFCILSSITCITGMGDWRCIAYPEILLSMICAFAGLYGQGLAYGGPVVLVWGWVCAGTLHTLVGLAMSELCSAFPVSGGLYYWSFMLAGKHGPLASWIVGWINLLGQVILCSHNLAFGQLSQELLFCASSACHTL